MTPPLPRRRSLSLVLAIAAVCFASGCQLFSPAYLWKLNRHPPLSREDAYFSISNDRLAPAAANAPENTAKTPENDVMTTVAF